MADVLAEVKAERKHQDEVWGGPEHDDEHATARWYELINERFFDPGRTSPQQTRRLFIEIAALAVAAVESLDRRTQPTSTGEKES